MDSRTHHARGLTSLHPTQPPSVPTAVYHEGLPLSTIDAFQPYRNSNAYTYGNVAGGRAYISWGAPAYCDHSQEQQSESSYHHGMYSPSYAPQPESRYLPPYQPTAAAPKPLPPFVDAEPTAYGYGAQSTSIPTTATTTLAHRPAPVVDTTSGSWYQNVASSLSGSAGSSKVLNPIPNRLSGLGLRHLASLWSQ